MTLQEEIHDLAKRNGFWDFGGMSWKLVAAVKLALVHSEASEALEDARSLETSRDALGEELADAVIRVYDLAEYLGSRS